MSETNHELTYINVIGQDGEWNNADDYDRVFKMTPWRAAANHEVLKSPTSMNWQLGFAMPKDAGKLSVSVREAKRKTDGSAAILLELGVKGRAQETDDRAIVEWFELAHEWIVRAFTDLTTDEMQKKVWKRVT